MPLARPTRGSTPVEARTADRRAQFTLLVAQKPDRGPHVQQDQTQASSPVSATGGALPHRASPAGVAALAQAVARGDQDALATLYRSRLGMVVGLTRKWTGRDEAFALDVVQETFVRVIDHRSTMSRLRSEGEMDAWLTALARSAAIDLIRREVRAARRERTLGGQRSSPDQPGARLAAAEELLKALTAVGESDRAALRLRTSGATLAQIAGAFGTTVGSVHGRIRRALSAASRDHRKDHHE